MANSSNFIYFEEELFYELLERQQLIKIAYIMLMTVAFLGGLIGNSLIISWKLRSSERGAPFECLTTNAAIGMLLLSLSSFNEMIQETTHDIITRLNCYANHVRTFGECLVIISLIALLLLLKLKPSCDWRLEGKVIGFIWLLALIESIPPFKLFVMQFKTEQVAAHRMCQVLVPDLAQFKFYYFALLLLAGILPVAVFAIFFAILAVKGELFVAHHRSLWIYSIAVAAYYLTIVLLQDFEAISIMALDSFIFTIPFSYCIEIAFNAVVIVNPAVYFFTVVRAKKNREEDCQNIVYQREEGNEENA